MEDDKEKKDLKQCFEIVQDNEVAIDAIPLATKPVPIVNFQIHRKGRSGYYEIMRADGSAKTYLLPEEGYERVLWGNLKTMFEHHVEDLIWRNLQGKKVLLWRLYDSCGIPFVRFEDIHAYMLVEKRYPLTPVAITDILNKKLQADYWNEMSKQDLFYWDQQYGYFISKRIAFPAVEYYARNNWAKHGLKRIMMNSKGFIFFKFDSKAGLEAVLEGVPWLIRKSPIILKKWSMDTRLLKEEFTRIPIWVKLHDSWGRSSFARCLIEVNSEADLVDVVTISIPSLTGDDFTKETIYVEYEWRPPRCDTCKIFSHVHDNCPKKMVTHPIVVTSNVVTPTVEKTNDGFQTVGKKKKKKGKSKSNNHGQYVGPSVKQNVSYEPIAPTSASKKGDSIVGNATNSSSLLKNIGTSSNQDKSPPPILFLP
ncbi:zinc knuckle CX2CX4HX4C containing protein [Tanacetum coccineum]